MKIIRHIAFLAAITAMVCSCDGNGISGTGSGDIPADADTLSGSWHMTSWGTVTAADIYVDFRTDGTFDLYQRVYSPYYEHFDGTWTLDGNTLDGNYSDGTPWRSSYTVSLNEDASGLTLTDTFDSEDVSRFIRAAIPEDILSGILGTKGTMETSSGKGFL